MPIRLQERLLGEVLGVVVVADPVVAVRVNVTQVRAVQLGEASIQLRLVLRDDVGHGMGAYPRSYAARTARPRLRRFGWVTVAVHRSGSIRPSRSAVRPSSAGVSSCADRATLTSSGTQSTASATWPSITAISCGGTPWDRSSPARRLREPVATTVATRSPAPARPAKVSGLPPRERAIASTSANTLPAAAPATFGPALAAAAAASAAAFLAQPASSTPVTSVVVPTSSPAEARVSASWRAEARPAAPTPAEAPCPSTSI